MAVREGEEFNMVTFDQTQVRLATDPVKEMLTDLVNKKLITAEQFQACFKEISFMVTQTKRRDISKKPKYTPPNLDNMTILGLVDNLGKTREAMSALKKDEGIYKERLKWELAQLGETSSPVPEDWSAWMKRKAEEGDDEGGF